MGWVRDYYVVETSPADNPTGYMVRHWLKREEDEFKVWDDILRRIESLPAPSYAAALELFPSGGTCETLPAGAPFKAGWYWRVER